ncbi:MAG: TraB/GumN family protein [Flavobacteriales bacterium]|nr:TraB/GumN family protein [Flavobacteriales bacterium]
MRSALLFLLLWPAWAWGQGAAQGLLWKIEGRGLARPSYVVGTVHSRDARAFGQVPQLLDVIDRQDAVAGELDLTSVESSMGITPAALLMPAGKELSDLLSPGKLRRVEKALQGELGPMASMMHRMKPFFLAAMLSERSMGADSALVLDHYLQAKAKERGKEVLGVETVAEQLAAVDKVPLQEQADMLYAAVRGGIGGKDMDRLLAAYAAQDLDRLAALVSKTEVSSVVGRELLVERNRTMAARMDSLLQGGRTYLFAFGAAHLAGPAGVLAQLRAAGYSVVAVEPLPQPR